MTKDSAFRKIEIGRFETKLERRSAENDATRTISWEISQKFMFDIVEPVVLCSFAEKCRSHFAAHSTNTFSI